MKDGHCSRIHNPLRRWLCKTDCYLHKTTDYLSVHFPVGVFRLIHYANVRWAFLEGHRRTRLRNMLYLRELEKWNVTLWDMRPGSGNALVRRYTLPTIALIEVLLSEYGVQAGLMHHQLPFSQMLFIFYGNGIIESDLKEKLEELRKYRERMEAEQQAPLSPLPGENDSRTMYHIAENALARLEQTLRNHAMQLGT